MNDKQLKKFKIIYQALMKQQKEKHMPAKKNVVEPRGAAKVVMEKVMKMTELAKALDARMVSLKHYSDAQGRTGDNRALVIKSVAGNSGNSTDLRYASDWAICTDLTPEHRLRIMDKICELTVEYLQLEIKDIYEQIRKIGGDI